eukprot:4132142-Prymnesium_polylepis.2
MSCSQSARLSRHLESRAAGKAAPGERAAGGRCDSKSAVCNRIQPLPQQHPLAALVTRVTLVPTAAAAVRRRNGLPLDHSGPQRRAGLRLRPRGQPARNGLRAAAGHGGPRKRRELAVA